MSKKIKPPRCDICGCVIVKGDENAVLHTEFELFGMDDNPEAQKAFKELIAAMPKKMCGKCHERQDREVWGHYTE